MAIVETSHWARDSLSSLTSSAVKKQSQHDPRGSDGETRNYFVVNAHPRPARWSTSVSGPSPAPRTTCRLTAIASRERFDGRFRRRAHRTSAGMFVFFRFVSFPFVVVESNENVNVEAHRARHDGEPGELIE